MQDMAPEVRKRPFGRSLADCRKEGMTTPHGVWPAEEKLLEAAAKGVPCRIGSTRPDEATDGNKVDPLFLRFLLLGGDESAPVHEKRVEVHGAFITGNIDLEGCDITRALWLFNGRVDGSLIGANAKLGELFLQKSNLRSINCRYASLNGSVFLSEGFEAGGEIGDVLLSGGFEAEGEVRFAGAEIGGQINCIGGKLKNAKGIALTCDSAKVTGNVFLSDGFETEGEVRFGGAQLQGSLACMGGAFCNPIARPTQKDGESKIAADALSLHGANDPGPGISSAGCFWSKRWDMVTGLTAWCS